MNVLFLTVTFLVVTLKVHLNMRTVPCFACFLSFLLIPFVQLIIPWRKQLACSWFAQVVFGSISFPYLSLSNLNNVHNTYLVATLIHVVKSSISLNPERFPNLKEQSKVFLLLLTLQIRWNILINAENNHFSESNESVHFLHRLAPSRLLFPRLPRDFNTCAIWFTTSRAAVEPMNSSNSRGLHKQHGVANRIFSLLSDK